MTDRFARTRTAIWASVVLASFPLAGVPAASAADRPPAAAPLWSADTKYDLVRLDVGAGGSVVFARDGAKLTGLSAADGSVKYQRALPGFEEKGYWGRPEDTTYVYTSGKELVGIDVATGQDRWHASPGDGVKVGAWRAPAIGSPKALLLAFDNGVSVWDIAAGKVLWSAREPLNEDLVPRAWARDDDPDSGVLLFLPKRTVLVGASGKELWSAPESGNERRGGKDNVLTSVRAFGRLLLVYTAHQVALLNNATGEVLASQSFPNADAAADVEAYELGDERAGAPLLVTLGGRLVAADPKEGKVILRTPEGSIVGQMAKGGAAEGGFVVLTAVRGSEKTPNVGLHLYRVDLANGAVVWHAANGGTIDTRQVMRNVVGEKVNGPFYLAKAKGVLLATDGTGVRLYDWADGKERWAVDENLPESFEVMTVMGNNSFAILRSMVQNRYYVSTNPPPVEGDGVVYVAGKDQVFAIDAASGKVRWASKSKAVEFVSGLGASGGTVIVRQGLYRDANDFGEPTVVVTRFLGPTTVEDPKVYIDEDPYGFVGLDAATGAEQWKCTDFEARDPLFDGPMPSDASVCQGAPTAKEKGCKPSKLGVGGIVKAYPEAGGAVFLGKGGLAGVRAGSCAAAWTVDGSVKKLAKIYDLDSRDDALGLLQVGDPGVLVAHYGSEVSVVDLAAGRVAFAVGKADTVKVVPSAKLLFAAEGSKLSAYRLP